MNIIDSDEEMIMMIMNFLMKCPPLDLFVNPILITQIEAFLVYKYKNGGASSFLMLSDENKKGMLFRN